LGLRGLRGGCQAAQQKDQRAQQVSHFEVSVDG